MSVQTAMPETVMSLVPSLLQAIVRVDGEALVMHVGEKPYVVSPNGQIDLATRGLTFDAVNGLVSQLLPPDAMRSLEEVGATQFELPALDEFPGEHFTVTAARGGDDVWAEIRRRPAHDDDLVAVDLFASLTAPKPVTPAPASDDLALPQERQLWPPHREDVPAPEVVEPTPDSSVLPTVSVDVVNVEPVAPVAPAVESSVAPAPELVDTPIASAPVVDTSAASVATPSPVVAAAPNVSQAAIANWLAEFATAATLHKPEAQTEPDAPAAVSFDASSDVPVDTPAEPAVSVTEPEPEPAPAFVTPSAPPVIEARAADRKSEADMFTPPQEVQPFSLSTPAVVGSAPESFDAGRLGAVDRSPAVPTRVSNPPLDEAPRPVSAFVPFPSLADQPQPAVVLPIGRAVRESVASEQAAAGLERLLRLAASRGATALYLSSGTRPSARLDGDVQTLDGTTALTAADIDALLLGAAPESAAMLARAGGTVEWVWHLDDVGSVRCTSFRDHRGPGAVFRIVAVRPHSAAQLGLSREIQGLVGETEGLVLVSGPRANGKSTLISSLVDVINRTRRDYVITIESEVNVVHESHGAFVSQREVRGGSDDALAAARAALREDPDVLVIDDLRTAGLMSVALDAAANGQLVIGGVPAHHASGAVERLIDLYHPEQRRQVQLALAQNLRGVVSQVLLRKSGGGRVAAREILLNTPIVSSLLAEGRMNQLPVAIEGGRRSGMVPLNDALVGFVQSGAVDVRDAYRRAVDRPGLLDLLKRQGIDTSVVERLA